MILIKSDPKPQIRPVTPQQVKYILKHTAENALMKPKGCLHFVIKVISNLHHKNMTVNSHLKMLKITHI